ncbi:hypothetical protein, partial [Streptomyces rhizosphaericus]
MTDSRPVLVLKIGKSWNPSMSALEVYEVTRKWWRVSLPKARSAHLVLAVSSTKVVGAFLPRRWMPSPDHEDPLRFGFEGAVADDWDRWVGADMAPLFPKGAANPVRHSLMSEVEALLPEQPLPVADTAAHEPLVLVLRINQRWSPDLDPDELYEVTRKWWVMSRAKAERVDLVLAVADGLVREAYRPMVWLDCPERGLENRIGFEGGRSEERDDWIGTD